MKSHESNVPKDAIREFFKQWPALYYAIVYTLGPVYLGYMSPRHFLRRFFPRTHSGERIYNLGSGPRVIREDVINVDMTAYEGVALTASLEALPIETESADGFVCDNVLEHVERPGEAVGEMYRILKPGGVGYVSTPFLYPFHSSPSDYTRWTEEGLRLLCKDFEVIEVGTRSGVFSSLTVWLCYVFPSVFSFGSERLYWLMVNLSLLVFFPIKFLDVLANRLPFATRTAATLYGVVRKRL